MKETRNIVFLDVDGVLNNWYDAEVHYKETKEPFFGFDWPFSKESMETLREIVLKTNSKIVVTSSWRCFAKGKEVLNRELEEYGLAKYVIGYTPEEQKADREKEIIQYLETEFNEGDDIRFVILDDEAVFYNKLDKHFVEIDSYHGLTKEYINKCINILKFVKSGWK